MQVSRMEQIMDDMDAYCRTHSKHLSHAQVFDHARDVVIAELNQADALCENDLRHYTRAESWRLIKAGARNRDWSKKASGLTERTYQ